MGDEPDHTPLRIRDCARRMRCFGVCQSFGSNCDDSAPGINLVIVGPDYFRIADNAGIDQSMTPSALIGSNPTDESIVSGLPVILDNIHFGQGRASRIRFSGEISKQESEYASPRLRFEKRLDGIVFRQESADKQAAEDGRRVRRGALASVSIHADGHGTFLALRF
jgi:hypothetical protein